MVKRFTREDVLHNMSKKGDGLRACIDRKCVDCIYDPLAAGTWRMQVADCTVTECGLYPVRAKTGSTK